MKIKGVECTVIDLPARRPHKWIGTVGEKTIGKYLIVKLKTDDGTVGYGEATVLPTWGGDHGMYYGETVVTAKHVIEAILFHAIVDGDPHQIERLLSKMDAAVVGYPYAKAAIDMALFDIAGKSLSAPAYDFLGGVVRKEVPIAHSIGLMDLEQAVEEAKDAVKEGVQTIKLKIGLNPEDDILLVEKVREAIGENVKLVVDANQGYPTPKVAIQTIKKMEKYRLAYFEQPVEGLEMMAQVCRAVDVPIMADESVWTHYDVIRIAEVQAADYISIYTTKPGGLWRAKKVAAVAEACGLECNVNGSAESGVGNAANLHLAASTSIIRHACVIPVTTIKGKEQTQIAGRLYTDDVIKNPFRYENGMLMVPDGPGLGIEVDEDKIRKYAVSG